MRAPLANAVQLIRDFEVGCLPVTRRDRVVGIVTRGNLYRSLFDDTLLPACSTCGSHHHVRRQVAHATVAFCLICLRRRRTREELDDPEELYQDLGGSE
jgi:hypothetical protein